MCSPRRRFKLQARTLAEDRGIRCVTLDYDRMRGVEPEGMLPERRPEAKQGAGTSTTRISLPNESETFATHDLAANNATPESIRSNTLADCLTYRVR